MVGVTELKNGKWLVCWLTESLDSIENVECGQAFLQLKSALNRDTVSLTLTVILGKEYCQMLKKIVYISGEY
jgi:hypothetical protein